MKPEKYSDIELNHTNLVTNWGNINIFGNKLVCEVSRVESNKLSNARIKREREREREREKKRWKTQIIDLRL